VSATHQAGGALTPETAAGLLEAVTEVARLAGAVALTYFDQARRSHLDVEFKTDGSPVTAADRASESTAREWIEKHFPDDGILGEELGAVRPHAARRWIIDPIDGTKSFVRGVPLWGTLVAVAEGDAVFAGAIHCAAAGEMVSAAVGQGAWWNGVRCQVSRQSVLARATVLATDAIAAPVPDVAPAPAGRRSATRPRRRTAEAAEGRRRWEGWLRVAERAAVARTWGDAYGYLLVATGRAEVMMDVIMHPWDTAALAPVIHEAGGVFTDWHGAPTALGGSSVATNAALAEEVRALLNP
jgi:fructose-1,6-bisphosphatase/inositol monophosphatase family enzyme